MNDLCSAVRYTINHITIISSPLIALSMLIQVKHYLLLNVYLPKRFNLNLSDMIKRINASVQLFVIHTTTIRYMYIYAKFLNLKFSQLIEFS